MTPEKYPERQPREPFRLVLALCAAEGEYQLEEFDRVVLRRFGSCAPFPQLYKDHQRRVNTLQYLCRKYHLGVPKNTMPRPECPKHWPEVIHTELTLLQGNLRVYDNLLILPVHEREVDRVLTALRNEIIQTHLPLVLAQASINTIKHGQRVRVS